MVWIRIAASLMFLGVAFGAFGAHGLKNKITEDMHKIYGTGVLYHLLHALGLFVVAWLNTISQDPKIKLAGILMSVGILLFSGSLYLLAITGAGALGAITPIGGVCFLLAWILILAVKS